MKKIFVGNLDFGATELRASAGEVEQNHEPAD
jgi:hypothetical protein